MSSKLKNSFKIKRFGKKTSTASAVGEEETQGNRGDRLCGVSLCVAEEEYVPTYEPVALQRSESVRVA